MAPIVETIEVRRPPEHVFAYATDPSRFAEWKRHVVGGHMEDDATGSGRGASPGAGSGSPSGP
jgi:uncharacterized protein YndB with AHSA1/START domain